MSRQVVIGECPECCERDCFDINEVLYASVESSCECVDGVETTVNNTTPGLDIPPENWSSSYPVDQGVYCSGENPFIVVNCLGGGVFNVSIWSAASSGTATVVSWNPLVLTISLEVDHALCTGTVNITITE